MGKASRWFRGLLGMKKTDSTSTTTTTASPSPSHKDKRRWSFVKSHTHRDRHYDHPLSNGNGTSNSPATVPDNKEHAIAVAAATAAVAEAAVAAAHAAAAVVRLTSNSGRCADAGGVTIRQQWAAVKIQAAFRGSLARKALRALKGLVKLQALVRGHIERKRTAEWLKRMQALLQAQAGVSAGWTPQISHSSTAKLSSNINSPATPEKFESPIRSKSVKYEQSPVLKRNGAKSCVQINGNQEKRGNRSTESQGRSLTRTHSTNDDRSDRILETDTGNSHFTSKRRNLFHSTSHHSKSLSYTTKESTSLQSGQSSSYCEVEENPFCTANNSPQYLSATSKDETFKRSPFTPTKSDGSRSCYLRGYSDYPSYMACTESSKAKARSLSAPKQRPPQHERSYSSSSTRYSLNVYDMSRLASQRASTIHSSFTNKAYPGSGRLDRLGMPVGYKY